MHELSHPRNEKNSALEMLGGQEHPMVILLPVCQDHLAVFHDGQSFSLPIAFPATDETFAHAAQRLVVTLGNFKGSTLSCTGTISTVELCRADIPVVHGLPALSLPGMQWQAAARVHMREACHRAHFAALCLFGVLPPCYCVVMMMMPFICSYRNKNEPTTIYPSLGYSPTRKRK